MLSDRLIEKILTRLPGLTIGVLGDLFLDRYLDIDAALTEPSLETGLDAYQVTRVRSYPGAAGTVINNLATLGVGRILPVSVVGEDGEGFELIQALKALRVVPFEFLQQCPDRCTPTYTKPMLCQASSPPRELNRLDIKNRSPLPQAIEDRVLTDLDRMWRQANAMVILDQVSEPDCGVVTGRVRHRLAELAAADPEKFVLADSRERIVLFRNACLKPNERECRRALGLADDVPPDLSALARLVQRPVFCSRGADGILLVDENSTLIPAYPVQGPIDIVGAGDSTSAGIVCARAAGASLAEAAAFGCLVASITIQQLGVTGTATPEQVRRRWQVISENRSP
jgi:bifunctional ADP-heptose synthase (sugar kinase/adenylyltransferase)